MNDTTTTRPTWRYTWHDGTGDNGPITRASVADMLRTVRSHRPHGQRIKRTATGYRIGLIELIRLTRPTWRYTWHDITGQTGPCPREHVAYLLRAARSRRPLTGERIERTDRGYLIGTTRDRIGTLEVWRTAA